MNDFRPTIGIEFDDNYKEAKNKLIEFIAALNKLTEEQSQELAREFLMSVGMGALFEQFIKFAKFINNGGRF